MSPGITDNGVYLFFFGNLTVVDHSQGNGSHKTQAAEQGSPPAECIAQEESQEKQQVHTITGYAKGHTPASVKKGENNLD